MIWVSIIFGLLDLLLTWLLSRPSQPLTDRERTRLNRLIAKMNMVRSEAVRQGCSAWGESGPMESSHDDVRAELLEVLQKAARAPSFFVDAELKSIARQLVDLIENGDPDVTAVIAKLK